MSQSYMRAARYRMRGLLLPTGWVLLRPTIRRKEWLVGRKTSQGEELAVANRVDFVFYIRHRIPLTGEFGVRSNEQVRAKRKVAGPNALSTQPGPPGQPDLGRSVHPGIRISALRVHSKSLVAMPWAPSPQRLDRPATSTCLGRFVPSRRVVLRGLLGSPAEE